MKGQGKGGGGKGAGEKARKLLRAHFPFLFPLFPVLLSLLLVSFPLSAAFAEPTAYQQALAAFHGRRLEEAYRLAQQAVEETPGNPEAHFLLGQLHYLRQELREAQRCWEKALALSPDRNDIRAQLEKLKEEKALEEDLARGDAHPFVVRFAKGQIPVDLSRLKALLREAHRKIGQPFQHFLTHRLTVLLYSAEDFERVKRLSHPVAGLYDGKIRLPLAPGPSGGQELTRILWHEYTHAVVHDLAKGRCPLWLNEGIAKAQEDRVQPVEVELARAAFTQRRLPSWDSLWAGRYEADTLALYYQVSYLVVAYLVQRWSWLQLKQLLVRLGEGASIQQALARTYLQDPAALEAQWRRWLEQRWE